MIARLSDLKKFMEAKTKNSDKNVFYLPKEENDMMVNLICSKYAFLEEDKEEMLDEIAKHPVIVITRHPQHQELFVLAHIASDGGIYHFSIKKFKF